MTYNLEDCSALSLFLDWIIAIPSQINENGKISKVDEIMIDIPFRLGRINFQIQEFNTINKYAYFDYQRSKIFLRSSKNIKRAEAKEKSHHKICNRANKEVVLPIPEKCPICNSNQINGHGRSSKIVTDLKFTQGGIKRDVVRYIKRRVLCNNCGKASTPKNVFRIRTWGRNLKAWIVHQYLTHRNTAEQISEMAYELFKIKIPKNLAFRVKTEYSILFRKTYDNIKFNVLTGQLIHIDETKVSIGGVDEYIWVFTNLDTVFFLHRQTREADFLKEILKDFNGILISDFYPGYDSIPCAQQKCLVHLIRDLNDDLFKNPFDNEFKQIVSNFGRLLKRTVDTIDRYGLKKRHLNKHVKEVDLFYKRTFKQVYTSDLATKYQKRFKKNRNKLFTFLKYNGIPWNNNNAEHALKPFAIHRKSMNGLFTQNSIEEFLILFSIKQTCRYRGISFLEFLRSDRKKLEL